MASNGLLPVGQLEYVQGTMRLKVSTAYWWRRMKADAARAGHDIRIAAPAGAYRTRSVQSDMHRHPERYNLNPASSARLAPVGFSGHGWGDRIDVIGDLAWVKANGSRYGFTLEFPRTDPNHFKHSGAAIPPSRPKPPVSLPGQIEIEDDMKLVLLSWVAGKGTMYALAVPGTSYFVKWTAGNSNIYNAFATANGRLKGTVITESLAAAFELEADRMLPARAVTPRMVGDDTPPQTN